MGSALEAAYTPPFRGFSWSWLGFTHFNEVTGFAAGALVAAFYFWGWDVSSNLAEETKDGQRSAGLGGILGLLVVFALFEIFTIATTMSLSPAKPPIAGRHEVPVPGDHEPGPRRQGPRPVVQPAEGSLNAFDIAFDGRLSAGRK
jgi:amino acid transporter